MTYQVTVRMNNGTNYVTTMEDDLYAEAMANVLKEDSPVKWLEIMPNKFLNVAHISSIEARQRLNVLHGDEEFIVASEVIQ